MRSSSWLASLRWWHLLLFAIGSGTLSLVVIASLIRSDGSAQLKRTIDDLAAQGWPTTPAEMLASLPPLDRPTQQRYRLLEPSLARLSRDSVDFSGYRPSAKGGRSGHAWLTGDGAMPEEQRALVREHAEVMQPVRELLREGRLVLGSAEEMQEQIRANHRRYFNLSQDLTALRPLAGYLRLAALAGDPHALDDLDALHQAVAKPVTIMDVMTAWIVTDLREQAYVDLALLGRLPSRRGRAWTDEPFMGLRYLAEGIRCDLFMMTHWVRSDDQSPWNSLRFSLPYNSGAGIWGTVTEIPGAVCSWLFIGHDSAVYLRVLAAASRRMAGSTGGSAPTVGGRLYSPMGAMMFSGTLYTMSSVHDFGVRHRAARLAVRVIQEIHAGATAPADANALTALVQDSTALAATPDMPPLTYVRHDERHFRIAVDTAAIPPILTPIPWLLFEDPYASWKASSGSSKATVFAAKPTYRTINVTMVEVRVPDRAVAGEAATFPAPPGDPTPP